MVKALLLSTLAVNTGLLLGRLSGFAREAFVAATYGATSQADIVVLMLTVPDLLVNILMGGAMGAMLVPQFSQYPKQAQQLLYQSLLFFGLVFSVIVIGLQWQVETLVALLAPGFSETRVVQGGVVLSWVVWLIPLTVLAGIVKAFLHAQNRFAVAALGTLIVNSAIIIGLLLVYYGHGSFFLLAIFILSGGLLRLLSQLLLVRPVWSPIGSLFPWRLNEALLVHFCQALFSGSMLLMFPVVARALASYEGDGSVAIFNYASRLIEFPLAIAITFLTVILFPRIAQSFTTNPEQHRLLIRYGVQVTLGLALVAAITLISLSGAYAEAVYSYGKMQSSSVLLVAELLAIGLAALPFQGFSVFMTAVFNARKNTRTPLLLNGVGLLFFLLISYAELFGQGLHALMWGMVASYGLICILLLMFFRIEAFSWRHVLLDRSFNLGITCAVLISACAGLGIEAIGLNIWYSLILACFFAMLSLFVMALFNREIRYGLKLRLSSK